MADVDLAISNGEADALFATLEQFDALVLAVSGGADSMALLALIAGWSSRGAIGVSVATVDHGLRAESRDEARFVANYARRVGFSHVTLDWIGPKPASGIEAAARAARYALLGNFARKFSDGRACAVVTAHHEDDQAETVLMRLARGSGVDGLAGMPGQRTLEAGRDAQLVRPLLDVPRGRLRATLLSRGVAWLDDPMNSDSQYERVRVRQILQRKSEGGLTASALAKSARRLADAQDALRYGETAFLSTLGLSIEPGLYARLDRSALLAGPRYLQVRVLRDLIARFGGATPRPSLFEVERLAAAIGQPGQRGITLGGVAFSFAKNAITLWREFGRIAATDASITPGIVQLWDGRFRLTVSHDAPAGIVVRPLGNHRGGAAGAERWGAHWSAPRGAMYALPSFWTRSSRLLAVPNLGLYSGEGQSFAADAI